MNFKENVLTIEQETLNIIKHFICNPELCEEFKEFICDTLIQGKIFKHFVPHHQLRLPERYYAIYKTKEYPKIIHLKLNDLHLTISINMYEDLYFDDRIWINLDIFFKKTNLDILEG